MSWHCNAAAVLRSSSGSVRGGSLQARLSHELVLWRCAQECFAHIDTAMGGKAAEELIFGIDKVRAQ